MSENNLLILLAIVALLVAIIVYVVVNRKREKARLAAIESHRSEWGDEICDSLRAKTIALDMTHDMVRLGWGKPDDIDKIEILKSGEKQRWVYGIPRRGASYVHFKNGLVTRIQE